MGERLYACFRLAVNTSVAMILICLLGRCASAQEVALTIDDLPNHAPMPAGVTRVDVAKRMLAALADAKVNGMVYGFINAGKLETHPEEIEVLKLWREAGQPLGNPTNTPINFYGNSTTTL